MKNNWIAQIKNHRKKVYSQCGEEGFIEFILQNIGVEINKMTLVEFGAGDGVSLSNSKYFIDKGAKGFLFDGDNKGNHKVHQLWLTKSSVAEIARDLDTFDVDLFLVDIDGNDYWLIDQFLFEIITPPKMIVCEINPIFKRSDCAVMPYNEAHQWKNNDYYGMSLCAIEEYLTERGYTLVFVNDSLNAYFVQNKFVPQNTTIEIEYERKQDHPKFKEGIWLIDDMPFPEKETTWTKTTYH